MSYSYTFQGPLLNFEHSKLLEACCLLPKTCTDWLPKVSSDSFFCLGHAIEIYGNTEKSTPVTHQASSPFRSLALGTRSLNHLTSQAPAPKQRCRTGRNEQSGSSGEMFRHCINDVSIIIHNLEDFQKGTQAFKAPLLEQRTLQAVLETKASPLVRQGQGVLWLQSP